MNILDFLKKYKKGTPLYSPIFGNGDIVFVGGSYSPISNVLPYNEETKHLLGTKNKQK